jgi:formylglycine-generating enzyme required for sulfatase activity
MPEKNRSNPRIAYEMSSARAKLQPPGGKPLHPPDVLLARAIPAWNQRDEQPTRQVKLKAFAIDRFEVTNEQYRRFLDAINPNRLNCGCPDP